MGVENFNYIILPRPKSHTSTRHSLADIPIASPKGCGPAIERIPKHGARFDRPPAEKGKATTKGTAIVELSIGENGCGGLTDGEIVGLGPAFLEADDIRRRVEEGKLAADFSETRGAEVRDVEQAPAVEGEEPDLGDGLAGALRG